MEFSVIVDLSKQALDADGHHDRIELFKVLVVSGQEISYHTSALSINKNANKVLPLICFGHKTFGFIILVIPPLWYCAVNVTSRLTLTFLVYILVEIS